MYLFGSIYFSKVQFCFLGSIFIVPRIVSPHIKAAAREISLDRR